MRETRRHRSSCYGPREDEDEEVGEATLFLRTQEPAKNLEHRTKPSHFLKLAVGFEHRLSALAPDGIEQFESGNQASWQLATQQ